MAWPASWFSPGVQFRAWVGQQDAVRTVHLAGRLGREHTAELLRICDEAPGPLRVDLANLVSADPTGLEALVGLEGRGAELTGISPYLALRLERARTAARSGNATPGSPAAPGRAGC